MTRHRITGPEIDHLVDRPAAPTTRRRIAVRNDFAETVARTHADAPARLVSSFQRFAIVTVASAIAASAAIFTVRVVVQQLPTKNLGSPIAELAEPFSGVRGIRELSDGRVLVNDYRDQFVKLVDLTARTVRPLGAHGDGPGEYLLPITLLPLGKDTTAINDMADGGDRDLILGDGTIRGTISTLPTASGAATITIASRGDGRGYIYSQTRTGNDSIAIERYDRGTGKRDIVAFVSPIPSTMRPRGGRPSGARGTPTGGVALSTPPFTTPDQWAVSNDGRIAVVSVEPYRVTFTETDGRRWAADPIPVSRIRVTEQHKADWREMRARPVAQLSVGPNGEQAARFVSRPPPEPTEWPAYLPPFLGSAVSFAPDGTLWVQRTTAAGAPATFDVIDTLGHVVQRVVFPPRTLLAGFGANSVYAIRRDNDDLEYLQRYALPR